MPKSGDTFCIVLPVHSDQLEPAAILLEAEAHARALCAPHGLQVDQMTLAWKGTRAEADTSPERFRSAIAASPIGAQFWCFDGIAA